MSVPFLSSDMMALLSMFAPTQPLPVGPMRVRKVLDGMHGSTRAALRRLIPAGDAPELETNRYPAALLAFFPKPYQYACLGSLAEHMLLMPEDITLETLKSSMATVLGMYGAGATREAYGKVEKSKTTQSFLDLLITTRKAMAAFVRGDLTGNAELLGKHVMGHPDGRTADQIFEVKTTGDLKKNWAYFLCQAHAYAALDAAVKQVYLVLPLQATVLEFDVSSWSQRSKFLSNLEAAAAKLTAAVTTAAAAPPVNNGPGITVVRRFNIGSHMPKLPTLLNTVKGLPVGTPSQIFVGSPQSSKCSIKDVDLSAAAAWIAEKHLQVYIHAPYMINLADTVPDDWAHLLLKKNLEAGAAMGCRGVVVHVGKSKGSDTTAAVELMRTNILRVLEFATEECPLLLETPAGQGTELLKGQEEFLTFVHSFGTKKLRACIDTCHVFACGHSPVAFVNAMMATDPDMLRLIHFNDSMDTCGACKDRHAFVGTGKIGVEVLEAVAVLAEEHAIPMILE